MLIGRRGMDNDYNLGTIIRPTALETALGFTRLQERPGNSADIGLHRWQRSLVRKIAVSVVALGRILQTVAELPIQHAPNHCSATLAPLLE
jgi:hypothetical protein